MKPGVYNHLKKKERKSMFEAWTLLKENDLCVLNINLHEY